MRDLSWFITEHTHFSVFIVLVALCMVAVLADGIKGRQPMRGPCAACRGKARKREEQR